MASFRATAAAIHPASTSVKTARTRGANPARRAATSWNALMRISAHESRMGYLHRATRCSRSSSKARSMVSKISDMRSRGV